MATVMTVRGPVAADQLGFTLPHEHALIDLVRILPLAAGPSANT